jgi:hypothetical protein
MPDNTVSVSRPSRWGNPFRVVAANDMWAVQYRGKTLVRWDTRELAAADAVDRFERQLREQCAEVSGWAASVRSDLGGKNLACFCPIGSPCHADVLLRIANGVGHE